MRLNMNNKHTLRCAVVGLGRISWGYHLPQICAAKDFLPVAVVDPDQNRLNEAKEKFHVEGLYTDLETMLKEVKPDLTVIASPTLFHKDQTVLALQHGSDVFCDKPVAMNLEDTRIMFETAQKLGRKLMVYQPHRVTAEMRTAQSILDSGKLGTVYQIERHVSNFVRRNDWQAFVENGGGMLFNYGAHYIDQLLSLVHDTTLRAKCELRRILSVGNADDVVNILLTTTKGITFVIDINQAVTCPMPTWRICGSLGTAICEGDVWRMKYCLPDALPEIRADQNFATAGRRYPGEDIPWITEEVPEVPVETAEYYRHCSAFFLRGEPPFVKAEETLELMRTIQLCREDAGPY